MEYPMKEWNTQAIVLAAGRSTRFKTKKTKMLFNICGQAMINYPLKVLEELNIPMTLVLGYQADEVQQEIEKSGIKNVKFTIQEKQLGTGNAVATTMDSWEQEDKLILNGDTPLITKELIQELLYKHKSNNAAITFCTSMVIDPRGYGRVVEENDSIRIIEEKNCTEEQKHINRINAGVYVISKKFLEENINKLEKNPLTGEVYLVDLVEMACKQGLKVQTHAVAYDDIRGVNTLEQLWGVEQIKRSQFIKYWMAEGVRFELAQSIHIDINVKLAPDTFIGTGVHLLGNTSIGEGSTINAFSIIEDSHIGSNSTVLWHSVVQGSKIGNNVQIGPFARLRNGSDLANNVSIGNFVELKNAKIGEGSKTRHLTYLGDSTIGEKVNVGAGTITCNYDGVKKHQTVIGDNAFIGSNNTLVAPLTIGEGAYTAGGSTITQDVPDDSLAIGRSKQEVKPEYAKKLRNKASCCCKEESKEKKEASSSSTESSKEPLHFQGAVKTENEPVNTL